MADRALGAPGEVGAVAHLHGALAADDLAAHLVSVGRVDESLDLHDRSPQRGEQHEDRVELPLGRARPGAPGHDLHGRVVVVEQPAVDVDLVDGGVGEGSRRGQAVRREGVAVDVVHDERSADAGNRCLEREIARIESAHEPQGDQASAQVDLGVDDSLCCRHGGRQRLLAQRGALGVEAEQCLLSVEAIGGGDDDGVARGHQLLNRGCDVRPEFIRESRCAGSVRVVEPGHLRTRDLARERAGM